MEEVKEYSNKELHQKYSPGNLTRKQFIYGVAALSGGAIACKITPTLLETDAPKLSPTATEHKSISTEVLNTSTPSEIYQPVTASPTPTQEF